MKYQINLLITKKKDFTDKVIYFTLHYLRYILVITQIVVIAVFLYRFKIDQELIDLKDELKQKEEIVRVSQSLLDEAKTADLKMKEIRSLFSVQDKFLEMIRYFEKTFPKDFQLTTLKVSPDEIVFEAEAKSDYVIRKYVEFIKNDKKFSNVEMRDIIKSDDGITLSITLQKYIYRQ